MISPCHHSIPMCFGYALLHSLQLQQHFSNMVMVVFSDVGGRPMARALSRALSRALTRRWGSFTRPFCQQVNSGKISWRPDFYADHKNCYCKNRLFSVSCITHKRSKLIIIISSTIVLYCVPFSRAWSPPRPESVRFDSDPRLHLSTKL